MKEASGTAFIAETASGGFALLSTLHCFSKDVEEEMQKNVKEVCGVAIEMEQPQLASRKKKAMSNEMELQKGIAEQSISHEEFLDRIRRYCYWFCYKKEGQQVPLMGKDFVEEHVRVIYDVVSINGMHCCMLLYASTI